MPWSSSDAPSHTASADTPSEKKAWSRTADGALTKTGDEGMAIRVVHSMVAQGTPAKKAPAKKAPAKKRAAKKRAAKKAPPSRGRG